MFQTLIMIKPDAVERGLVGQILARFEAKRYQIKWSRRLKMNQQFLEEFYSEHEEKEFYPRLIGTMKDRVGIFFVLFSEEEIIDQVRKMVGDTFCSSSSPGTIRFDFGKGTGPNNVIHASSDEEHFEQEFEKVANSGTPEQGDDSANVDG